MEIVFWTGFLFKPQGFSSNTCKSVTTEAFTNLLSVTRPLRHGYLSLVDGRTYFVIARAMDSVS